jgi:protein-tyrosine phosphatase
MQRSSYFIKDKALFGAYPSDKEIEEYENIGVKYFVDLTAPEDESRVQKYVTRYTYIKYSIKDRRIPVDWQSFALFIIKLSDIIINLKDDDKVFIHCIGGHGRSGIVVASLFCNMYDMSPSNSISLTTKCHRKRKILKEKWRILGSPQTRSQKHFITKFFEPLYVSRSNTKLNNYFSTEFDNFADVCVNIPNMGVFKNAMEAYDSLYKFNLLSLTGETGKEIMYKILEYKFLSNKNLIIKLINTGLRPIIFYSSDLYWGKIDECGENMSGILLNKLRCVLYKNMEKLIFKD